MMWISQDSTTVKDGSTTYTITQLKEENNYTITVAATNAAGSEVSNLVFGTTLTAGA